MKKLLLYCTKAKPHLVKVDDNEFDITNDIYDNRIQWDKKPILNGKIVAECDFEVEKIEPVISPIDNKPYAYMTRKLERWEITTESCLTFEEMNDYLKGKNGYAIHIKNLHIFDEPKELRDYKGDSKGNFFKIIEKAPQNMRMVLNEKLEDCILISIRPEWLCKILNGEKNIEVRKKVLKEMLNNE